MRRTKKDALKAILTALGKTFTEKTETGLLFQIAEAVEDGNASAGGVMVVSSTYDEQTSIVTLGKTWQEIFDALKEGVLCIVQDDGLDGNNQALVGLITGANIFNSQYYVKILYAGQNVTISEYTTDAADGYPSVED